MNPERHHGILARLKDGGLRSTDIPDLAVKLRMYKHADHVLGVVSAYLYDSIGDVGFRLLANPSHDSRHACQPTSRSFRDCQQEGAIRLASALRSSNMPSNE